MCNDDDIVEFNLEREDDWTRLTAFGGDVISIQYQGGDYAHVIVYSRDARHGVAFEGDIMLDAS